MKEPGHSSDTGGVKPMSITGRMVRERERCIGMTEEERRWRAQWLKDQILTEREPVYVQELTDAFRNPIRRFYQAPFDVVRDKLIPYMGREWAQTTRFLFTRTFIGIGLIYVTWYYFKYNTNDWTSHSGWRVLHNQPIRLPGDALYPQGSDRSVGADYATRGFKNAPI